MSTSVISVCRSSATKSSDFSGSPTYSPSSADSNDSPRVQLFFFAASAFSVAILASVRLMKRKMNDKPSASASIGSCSKKIGGRKNDSNPSSALMPYKHGYKRLIQTTTYKSQSNPRCVVCCNCNSSNAEEKSDNF